MDAHPTRAGLYCPMLPLRDFILNLADELQTALDNMQPAPVENVHLARKRTKFLRALLKGSGGKFSAQSKMLKDMSAILAPYRDAQVNAETYHELHALHPRTLLHSDLATITANPYYVGKSPPENKLEKLHTLSRDLRWELSRTVTDISETDYNQGVENSRKSCVKAMTAVQDSGDSEIVHQWRKKTKTLWYLLRFSLGEDARLIDPYLTLVENIGKDLGRIHDFDMFVETMNLNLNDPLGAPIKTLRNGLLKSCLQWGKRLRTTT